MILPKIHVEKNGSNINPIKVATLIFQFDCDGYIIEKTPKQITQIT